MIHDPMVIESTPWELLELPADLWQTLQSERAFRTHVDRAYTQALRKRVPPQKAKVARDTILKPTGRARVDLLCYPEDAFARLAGGRGAAVLDPSARDGTARAWEVHFAEHLDDLPAAHCLMVLWWAWVQREEELRAEGPRAVPDVFPLWSALIAYLGLFATEHAYVAARSGVSPEEAQHVLDGLIVTLKDRLMDRAGELGRSPEAKRYRLLERFLADEVHAARGLSAARLTLRGVERAPGPRLLVRLGLTGEVAASTVPPGLSLTPYACLERQARGGQPEQALEALSALPAGEQSTDAAERARAVAFSCIAMGLAAHGKLEKALATWGRAAPGTLPPESEADIVRLVTARFEELSKAQQERHAMDLLVRALRVVPGSSALRSLVTTEQHNRAIAAVLRIRGRVETKHTNLTDMRALADLIDELERSVLLGFEDARAHLEWARVAIEAHSIGGEHNRQVRVRLDRELARWSARAHREKLPVVLRELHSEFQAAARMGSRRARANVEFVERALQRLRARPEDIAGLVLAELVRLEGERAPHGPDGGDLPLLDALLFDLEPAIAAGKADAMGVASQLKAQVVALLAERAERALAQGLTRPLREPNGLRPVTDTKGLKTLLAAHEDLKRAAALAPGLVAVTTLLADVRACLERANATGEGRAARHSSGSAGERPLRAPLAAVLIVVAVIVFLLWLIRRLAQELRPVHR